MKTTALLFLALISAAGLTGCSASKPDSGSPALNDSKPAGDLPAFVHVKKPGADASSIDGETSHAFSYPLDGMGADDASLHLSGDALFERNFTDDVARPEFGLGPVYNNSSCIACHNRDGRGSLPTGLSHDEWKKLGRNEAILLRISVESPEILARKPSLENGYAAPVAVPGYSTQLFQLGSYMLREDSPGTGQAEVWAKLEVSKYTYPDGTTVELSKPIFKFENPYDMVSDPATGTRQSRLWQNDVKTSPRLGPAMYGLGLLEAIPEQAILENAAVDRSAEGVHGHPNYVFDLTKSLSGDPRPVSVGRFGLKANTPTLEQQAMGALRDDIGVTNSYFPLENILNTPLLDQFVRRTGYVTKQEADSSVGQALAFYSRTLAVPPRRGVDDPDVQTGGRLFEQSRCVSCHAPSFTTGEHVLPVLSRQTIYPFTDLLVHDMGEGLADGRQDFGANGREWKTRALWGIGLTQTVNPRAGFLHDGRARTLEEAILWHGGESTHSREKFAALSAGDRKKLLAFLKSL